MSYYCVTLEGGPPWGFRLGHSPSYDGYLYVLKVRPNSPAEQADLREGDKIITLSDVPAAGISHNEAVHIIDQNYARLTMNISRQNTIPSGTSNRCNFYINAPQCSVTPNNATSCSTMPGRTTKFRAARFDVESLTFSPGELDNRNTADDEAAYRYNGSDGIARQTAPNYRATYQVEMRDNKPITYGVQRTHPHSYPRANYVESVDSETDSIAESRPLSYPDVGHYEDVEHDIEDVKPIPISRLVKDIDDHKAAHPQQKKKVFADSAFYDDPNKKYPTMLDQIRMAHQVAKTLTQETNLGSRGSDMFVKRKQRAKKWNKNQVGDSSLDRQLANIGYPQENYTHYTELSPSAKHANNSYDAPFRSQSSDGSDSRRQANIMSPKSVAEFLEQAKLEPKVDHTSLPPEVSFNIAADLQSMSGRAGDLFAKRKARADKYVVDEKHVSRGRARATAHSGRSAHDVQHADNQSDTWIPPKHDSSMAANAYRSKLVQMHRSTHVGAREREPSESSVSTIHSSSYISPHAATRMSKSLTADDFAQEDDQSIVLSPIRNGTNYNNLVSTWRPVPGKEVRNSELHTQYPQYAATTESAWRPVKFRAPVGVDTHSHNISNSTSYSQGENVAYGPVNFENRSLKRSGVNNAPVVGSTDSKSDKPAISKVSKDTAKTVSPVNNLPAKNTPTNIDTTKKDTESATPANNVPSKKAPAKNELVKKEDEISQKPQPVVSRVESPPKITTKKEESIAVEAAEIDLPEEGQDTAAEFAFELDSNDSAPHSRKGSESPTKRDEQRSLSPTKQSNDKVVNQKKDIKSPEPRKPSPEKKLLGSDKLKKFSPKGK